MAIDRLRSECAAWITFSRREGQSNTTLAEKERILKKFFWFVEREGYEEVGSTESGAYLDHLQNGHLEPAGRFGQGGKQPKAYEPLRPNTCRYHWDTLSAWFAWQTDKSGCWTRNPFQGVAKVKVPRDTDVKPFSDAEIEALLAATKKSFVPTRDYAIIWLLLDTGIRASELCGIKMEALLRRTMIVSEPKVRDQSSCVPED